MRDYGNLICRVLLIQTVLMAFGLGAAQADKIYWIDIFTKSINRANVDGTEVETLVTMVAPSLPRSIVLDMVNEKMYWADTWFGDILRANLDGTEIEVVLRVFDEIGLGNPRGLGIDPISGRIYWSSFLFIFGVSLEALGTIESADLDGGNPTILFEGFMVPHDLVYDPVNRKVYWSTFTVDETEISSIKRSDPDGSNLETVFVETRATQPADEGVGQIAVDPDKGKIFWVSPLDNFLRCASIYDFYVQDLRDLSFSSSTLELVLEPGTDNAYWSVEDQGIFTGSLAGAATRAVQLPIDAPGVTEIAFEADFAAGGGGGGGGCFIATAAYGTPLAEDIDALREFRDGYLMNNALGAAFADAYYRLSPSIADNVAESRVLAAVVRVAIGVLLLLGSAAPEIGGGLVVVLAVTLEARRGRRDCKST